MKTHDDYVKEAIKYLDESMGNPLEHGAAPTQIQTINLALMMAIIDLIEELKQV